MLLVPAPTLGLGVPGGSWSSKSKPRAWRASALQAEGKLAACPVVRMLEWLDWKHGVHEAWLSCCSPGGMWSKFMARRWPQPFQM